MAGRIDIEQVLKELLGDLDLDNPAVRKQAFQSCLDYAEQNLRLSLDRNAFIARASDVLGQEMVFADVVSELVPRKGQEKLHMDYSPEMGMILSGNRSGLRYLSRLLDTLCRATLEGEHVHLPSGQRPLVGGSYPLTWYLESNRWFDKVEADDAAGGWEGEGGEKDEPPETISPRPLEAKDVFAIQLLNPIPEELKMTPRRIYLVTRTEKYRGQKVWRKGEDDSQTMWIFHFIRDDGSPEKIALEIDDPDVVTLDRRDLGQILGGRSTH